jgi:formamidopyrimidine-DNA glycosylase
LEGINLPEIPEMEVYKKQLNETIRFKKIVDVEINRPQSINMEPEEFREKVIDELPVYIGRRGKHLVLTLGNGVYLVGHLMLGGRLYLAKPEEKLKTKGSIVFHFLDGKRLYFINFRLGWLHALDREGMDEKLATLGIEPLDKEFSLEKFTSMLSEKKATIKSLLVDQQFIAGIGNCYSDEILFNASIRPDRKADDLRVGEISSLYSAIPFTLKEAILNGGYMDKPFAKDDKLTGGQNKLLKVYDREGENCYLCSDKIEMTMISGKKSYFCPTCQK